jgi:PadR family transcriptional regulator PadR
MKKCADFLNERRNKFVNALIKTPGFLDFLVLGILTEKPLHGRGIRKELESLAGHKLIIGPATIYPLLKGMEESALIKGRWDVSGIHPRRVYTITDKGRDVYNNIKPIIKIKIKEFTRVVEIIDREVFNE